MPFMHCCDCHRSSDGDGVVESKGGGEGPKFWSHHIHLKMHGAQGGGPGPPGELRDESVDGRCV